MSRNIKRIAHDLSPLAEAATELSALISDLLVAVEPQISFNEEKTADFFYECINASKKLAISTKLIEEYVDSINEEADQEGIEKN